MRTLSQSIMDGVYYALGAMLESQASRRLVTPRLIVLIACMVAAALPSMASPQTGEADAETPAAPIEIVGPQIEEAASVEQNRQKLDTLITERLSAIYAEVEGLERISVESQSGVVTLRGEVANGESAQDAVALAERVDGVILVRDQVERLRDLESNLSPAVEGLSDTVDDAVAGLPLLGVAFGLFLAIALLGHLLARWKGFWRRVLPNIFLAELVAQAVRAFAIIVGLVAALNLIGANALMGTILGGAGVIGIAIGFAVRDTLENYVASIMLSLRQPFRADDHVVIGEHEGIVMRLTSRATILMTLDGNHLRIPNADVFKGVILNYTRNPTRRFDFALGVDAEDDPALGMETGLAALRKLPFLLKDKAPFAAIEEVGDSSIVLRFYAWVDQTSADFLKARSLSIRAAKDALEADGFTLPEPIYRLRFDERALSFVEGASTSVPRQPSSPAKPKPDASKGSDATETVDVTPDQHIAEDIARERAESKEEDLLDRSRPTE